MCETAEINYKNGAVEHHAHEIEESLDALAMTILEDTVAHQESNSPLLIEAAAIAAALNKLSPIFPFSSVIGASAI